MILRACRNEFSLRESYDVMATTAGDLARDGRAGINDVSTAPSDETLALRAGSDFDAFAELYRRHLCAIFRFARAQTPSDAVAEDVTAHVFFKALSAAPSFKAEGSYKAWLFKIAHNTLSTWRTRSKKSVIVEELPDRPDTKPCPATQAVIKDARGVVWESISRLPERQREAVVLHYIEDLSIAEVAQAMERSRGAVRILLHRARSRLRGLLEHNEIVSA